MGAKEEFGRERSDDAISACPISGASSFGGGKKVAYQNKQHKHFYWPSFSTSSARASILSTSWSVWILLYSVGQSNETHATGSP